MRGQITPQKSEISNTENSSSEDGEFKDRFIKKINSEPKSNFGQSEHSN